MDEGEAVPNILPISVTVLDNALYHNIVAVNNSTSNTRKQYNIQWLTENGEPCDSTVTNDELQKLMKQNRPVESVKKYTKL